MNLNSMMIFAKVAENQSFTKASRALNIEKSTVSTKISQLEASLGTRLLNRTTRSVTLTEAGEGYFQYCQQIMKSAQDANEFAQTFTSEPRGLLRISAPGDFGPVLSARFFKPFLTKYPDLQLEIYLTEKEVDLVRDRFDVVLRAGSSGLKDSSLVAKKIVETEMAFYVSEQYLKNHSPIENLNDLQNHPFIYFLPNNDSPIAVEKNGENILLKLKRRITINSVHSCASAVESGLGIGILPVETILSNARSTNLVRILKSYTLPPASLYAIYPSRHWVPSKVKVFLAFLESWKD